MVASWWRHGGEANNRLCPNRSHRTIVFNTKCHPLCTLFDVHRRKSHVHNGSSNRSSRNRSKNHPLFSAPHKSSPWKLTAVNLFCAVTYVTNATWTSKAISANQTEISARRGNLTSLASTSVGTSAAAAASAAGVPHDMAEGEGDGGPKHGHERSVSVVEEGGVEERCGEIEFRARGLTVCNWMRDEWSIVCPRDVSLTCTSSCPSRYKNFPLIA